MQAVVFFVCAALILLGAFGVILARNPVHSALFLLLTLVNVAVLFLGGNQWATGAHATRGALHANGHDNIQSVAQSLFTTFLWPFEVTALLLVVAVVGGVVLARRSNRPAAEELEAETDAGEVTAP